MEAREPQENPNSDVERERQDGERRSPTQGVYEGEERRNADQQAGQMSENMAKDG